MSAASIAGDKIHKNKNVYSDTHLKSPIGKFSHLISNSDDCREFLQLFSLIKFDEKAFANNINTKFSEAAISKDICYMAFRSHSLVRLHKNSELNSIYSSKRKNSQQNIRRNKGFIAGDMTNAFVQIDEKSISFPYSILIRGKGNSSFANDGDGGDPVFQKAAHWLVLYLEKMINLLI